MLPPIQKKEQSRRRQPTVPPNIHSLPPEVQSHGQTTGQFLNSSTENVMGTAIVLDRLTITTMFVYTNETLLAASLFVGSY